MELHPQIIGRLQDAFPDIRKAPRRPGTGGIAAPKSGLKWPPQEPHSLIGRPVSRKPVPSANLVANIAAQIYNERGGAR